MDLEEEDDDLFQSARLEPEMSKFVGNTNGFSSRCTKKPYLFRYFTSFSCYHFAVLLSLYCTHFVLSHCALKVPKCEIFHLFDFNDFYGIKSL